MAKSGTDNVPKLAAARLGAQCASAASLTMSEPILVSASDADSVRSTVTAFAAAAAIPGVCSSLVWTCNLYRDKHVCSRVPDMVVPQMRCHQASLQPLDWLGWIFPVLPLHVSQINILELLCRLLSKQNRSEDL